MRLSIIIAVLDSHEVLRRQLLHFERMGEPERDTEIIIVDDGSDPPLENTANIPVTIHRTNDKRPWTWALARNAGARIATGEYVLMFDVDHFVNKDAIDFVRAFGGLKVQFRREFGVLDHNGEFTQDRDVLFDYGLPRENKLRLGPLPNNFAMRRDLFWELGGYREDLVDLPYPQGEDPAFRGVWHKFDPGGKKVCPYRPTVYMFPNGKYCGDVDADPKGLFHKLTRKTSRNTSYQQQRRRERAES